jgi:hypothetical protein
MLGERADRLRVREAEHAPTPDDAALMILQSYLARSLVGWGRGSS